MSKGPSPALFEFLEITLDLAAHRDRVPEDVAAAIKAGQAALSAARKSLGQLGTALGELSREVHAARSSGTGINAALALPLTFPRLEQQLYLFATPAFKPEHRQTTALYPNRQRDKAKLEQAIGLEEFGNEITEFFTPRGTLFAEGYSRIVYGDHGPYLEFRKDQIRCTLRSKCAKPCPPTAFYEWLCPTDGSGIKVYNQMKDVRHLRNPPAGGFRGNRAEGYADYRVGLIYVDPYTLTTDKEPMP